MDDSKRKGMELFLELIKAKGERIKDKVKRIK
jgi:hypothetical protein